MKAIPSNPGPALRASVLLASVLVLGLWSTACGGGSDAHEDGAAARHAQADGQEHDHGHEHGDGHEHEHGHESEGEGESAEAPLDDAHHRAERRTHCEEDVALAPEALERYGIRVEPVRAQALSPQVSAPGHLSFPQGALARIGSALAGRVVELRARSGALVERGEVLLVIESQELGEAQSDYLRQRALAAAALPAFELAQSALERARALHERVQGIALAELQQREADLRAAENALELARAAADAARLRLVLLGLDEPALAQLESSRAVDARLALRAPLAGSVIEVSTALGELVRAEDQLALVGELGVLWAIAEVGEARIAEVELGARARVRVPAFGELVHEGRVAALPTLLEVATRTAEVRIELANPERRLLPGMFIQVEIESARGAGEPVLVVPDESVLSVGGRPSVFVPIEPGSGRFCRHEVEVGAPIGGLLPVLAGLAEGELVVVSGTFRLKAEHGKAAAQHDH